MMSQQCKQMHVACDYNGAYSDERFSTPFQTSVCGMARAAVKNLSGRRSSILARRRPAVSFYADCKAGLSVILTTVATV